MKKLISFVLVLSLFSSVFMGAFAITTTDGIAPSSVPQSESGVVPAAQSTGNVIAEGTDPIAITSENVRVYGRNISKTGVQVSWENSGVEIHFNGRGVSVEISVSGASSGNLPYVQIWVDGERKARKSISNGSGNYLLASRLPEGEHTVKALLVTENFYTPLTFKNLTLSGENPQLLEPQYDHDQLIMDCYGDSLTAGHGTIGGYSDYCTAASDASITYAGYTGERLGADMQTIAISGWGMYQGYGADRNGIIPRIWKFESMSTSKEWDGFVNRQADVVTICLGTNDMWFWGDQDPELYIDAYVNFMKEIRKVYPEAYIFCLHGSIDDYSNFFAYVSEAARRFCAEDEIGATYVKLPDVSENPSLYTGTNGHPSGAYGDYASATLIDAIENRFYKDWQYKLLEAAEKLEMLDKNGQYEDVIASAKLTAEDRTSTGRNPKRFCKEIEALIENFSDESTENLKTAISNVMLELKGEVSETAVRVGSILVEKAEVAIEKGEAAEVLDGFTAKLGDVVTNIASDEELSKIDLGSALISAKFSLDGENYSYNAQPKNGDELNIKIRSLATAENISGKLKGSPYLTTKKGVSLGIPVSESNSNGIYEYTYSVKPRNSVSVELIVSGEKYSLKFAKVKESSPEFSFVTETMYGKVVPANPAKGVVAVADTLLEGSKRVAIVGEKTLAESFEYVWNKNFGDSESKIFEFDNSLLACVVAENIQKFNPDVIVLAYGKGKETADEDKNCFESAVRKFMSTENAPAIIAVSTALDESIDAERKEIADAYGIPFVTASDAVADAKELGYGDRTLIFDDGRLNSPLRRVLAEAACCGLYSCRGAEGAELPEVITDVSYMNLEVYTPENFTPKTLSNFTATEYEGDWTSGWQGTRGTIKFDVENAKSVSIVYGDLGGTDNLAILAKTFGKTKSFSLSYDAYSVNYVEVYNGEAASGEISLTLTFKSTSAVYAIIVSQ